MNCFIIKRLYRQSHGGIRFISAQPPTRQRHHDGEKESTLTLLVLRVFADNHHATLALDYLALLANGFDRRSDLHVEILLFYQPLLRHVIRPLVKSYGLSSMVTLSPG